jgi:zinc D-Ala-D-Ala dipeptidase
MIRIYGLALLFSLFSAGCDPVSSDSSVGPNPAEGASRHQMFPATEMSHDLRTDVEQKCMEAGLVDIQTIDSTIRVDLKYASSNNFLGINMYGTFKRCYLQPDVALKLKKAQEILHRKYPYYFLVVFDAVRPRSIQVRMWDTIEVPRGERTKYVSNPANGSLHNFGAAVDLSIVDENGIEMDMGTPYDYFGELAYPREEERMIREGKLTHLQLLNREILRSVMKEAGFMEITTEWWHFNSCYRKEAFEKYQMIE